MDLYKIILQNADIEDYEMAFDGLEAIEMFKSFKNHPEVIILDHRMPLKNGIETMKEIFEINPDVNVIFVSADVSAKERALSLGARYFIEKPFNLVNLIDLIQELMNPDIIIGQ